jgi:hypothetical protein
MTHDPESLQKILIFFLFFQSQNLFFRIHKCMAHPNDGINVSKNDLLLIFILL